MKNIVLLTLLIIATASFVGCKSETKTVKDRRKVYLEHFEKFLNDPRSLVVYKETIKEDNALNTIFVVDYGSKNRLGGMERNERIFEIWDDGIHRIDGIRYGEYLLNVVTGKENPER